VTRRILTVNPGSTTTKIVLLDGDEALLDRELEHPRAELRGLPDVWAQLPLRRRAVHAALDQARHLLPGLHAVVGRGGLLAPLPGGTYAIGPAMLDDLRAARHGEHACNLGAPLAAELADELGLPAFVVDPVVTDELLPEARPTGLPQVRRRSTFHALSQRGAAREAAARHGLDYDAAKLLVAHLGGGISVGAHLRGRVVDVTNALDGEGPFSPERTGTLPVLEVLRLLESGSYDIPALRQAVLRRGGLFALLGTNDFREIQARAQSGDHAARDAVAALAYNVAKHAAGLLPALTTADDPAPPDLVVLTGGLARSPLLTAELARRLTPLAPVEIVLGLTEALVMARGAAAVLDGLRPVLHYQGRGAA